MMKETVVKINDKGVTLVLVTILALTFALGYLTGNFKKNEGMVFNEKEIVAIQNAMNTYGEISVKKGKNGELTISATLDLIETNDF